jgi:hypothetical protein
LDKNFYFATSIIPSPAGLQKLHDAGIAQWETSTPRGMARMKVLAVVQVLVHAYVIMDGK